MKKKLLIIFTIIIALVIVGMFGFKRYEKYTTYKEDAEFLLNFIENNYPYFQVKEKQFGFKFLDKKKEYVKKISASKNDVEFLSNAEEVVNLLQNGHTQINLYAGEKEDPKVREKLKYWSQLKRDNFYLPDIRWEYIEGKYVVADSKNKDIPQGSVIETFKGVKINDYVKEHIEEFYWLHKDFKRDIWYSEMYGKYDKDTINITYTYEGKENKGNINFLPLTEENYLWYMSKMVSLKENFTTNYYEDMETAYLRVRSFDSKSLENDIPKIKSFLKDNQEAKNLIIDIRGNSSGTNAYGYNILSYLIKEDYKMFTYQCLRNSEYILSKVESRNFEECPLEEVPHPGYSIENFDTYKSWDILKKDVKSINYEGEIFILVDSYVYSASEYFINLVKQLNLATIVGVTTGGDGPGFQPIVEYLPKSSLGIRMSPCITFASDGTVNEETHTSPDIYVEKTLEDYNSFLNSGEKELIGSEYDTILNKVFEIIKYK